MLFLTHTLTCIFNLVVQGIARRLLLSALEKAAKMRQIPYTEIKKLDQGVRRHVHDDITIVVIFLDHEMLDSAPPQLSVRGFVDTAGPSNFDFPQGTDRWSSKWIFLVLPATKISFKNVETHTIKLLYVVNLLQRMQSKNVPISGFFLPIWFLVLCTDDHLSFIHNNITGSTHSYFIPNWSGLDLSLSCFSLACPLTDRTGSLFFFVLKQ